MTHAFDGHAVGAFPFDSLLAPQPEVPRERVVDIRDFRGGASPAAIVQTSPPVGSSAIVPGTCVGAGRRRDVVFAVGQLLRLPRRGRRTALRGRRCWRGSRSIAVAAPTTHDQRRTDRDADQDPGGAAGGRHQEEFGVVVRLERRIRAGQQGTRCVSSGDTRPQIRQRSCGQLRCRAIAVRNPDFASSPSSINGVGARMQRDFRRLRTARRR